MDETQFQGFVLSIAKDQVIPQSPLARVTFPVPAHPETEGKVEWLAPYDQDPEIQRFWSEVMETWTYESCTQAITRSNGITWMMVGFSVDVEMPSRETLESFSH